MQQVGDAEPGSESGLAKVALLWSSLRLAELREQARTVKGKDIKFSFKVSGQGQELQIEYAGTLEGDTMKGKVKLGELGEGTFSGKKE